MKTFTTIEEFEEYYFPRNVERYPVVLRCRVIQEEKDLIDDWITKRHSVDMIDDLKGN